MMKFTLENRIHSMMISIEKRNEMKWRNNVPRRCLRKQIYLHSIQSQADMKHSDRTEALPLVHIQRLHEIHRKVNEMNERMTKIERNMIWISRDKIVNNRTMIEAFTKICKKNLIFHQTSTSTNTDLFCMRKNICSTDFDEELLNWIWNLSTNS